MGCNLDRAGGEVLSSARAVADVKQDAVGGNLRVDDGDECSFR